MKNNTLKVGLGVGMSVGNIITLVCLLMLPARLNRMMGIWMSWGRMEARAISRVALQLAMPLSRHAPYPHAIYMDPPSPLPDITLINGHMDAFPLHNLHGSAVLMSFGATQCLPGCPDLLAQFKEVKKILGEDAQRVRFVMIGVDVQRDTPESLIQHVKSYDPDFMALTGDEQTILNLASQHGIWVQRSPGKSLTRFAPLGTHTLFINPAGQWVVSLPVIMSSTEIADVIRLELNR